ncbi:hypothetical protein GQ43DRAFT_373710 [Delitschia confertaspora ATCC 74209]|uniref:Ima1 N-terminal domain-containing protein n=1 Tax=Delitschia confertaspora ATCC 74209 TaxID=1513339 RepID=A0A9P4JNQ9_9PLEO|nr:hypothetical protein GQ43DRAFT_373710 [Delitschia confertaspora ATCC 74209]
MSILRRYLWCHYCTQKTPNTQSGVVRKFTCQNCGAVNYLDERGEITDPPAEATGFTSNFHYARPVPRATSPELAGPPEQDSLFCRECLKNQQLVATALAEYLPSPDDPEYTKYEATVDAYKNDLEQRYPQVCADCIPRVRSRIRAAGYAAKTDHLRRVLEKTRNGGALYGRSSWNWRNIVLLLAGWIYVASVIFGLLWHTFGALMRPEDVLNDESQCAYQAWNRGQVEPQCFDHMWVYAQIGLLCGLLSFWWNPKLQQKASGSSGRLKGLRSHMTLQAVLLAARILSMYYLAEVPSTFQNALDIFRAGHAFMGFFVLLVSITVSLLKPSLNHFPDNRNIPPSRSPRSHPTLLLQRHHRATPPLTPPQPPIQPPLLPLQP